MPKQLDCFANQIRQANQTHKYENPIRIPNGILVAACATGLMAGSVLPWQLQAGEAKADAIKEVMKTYHKAPKGEDPICKKALDGKASAEEIKKLVAAYKTLATSKPPKGDEASWKDKTTKLLAAAEALEKGGADAKAKYKSALDCKACHSIHKPD